MLPALPGASYHPTIAVRLRSRRWAWLAPDTMTRWPDDGVTRRYFVYYPSSCHLVAVGGFAVAIEPFQRPLHMIGAVARLAGAGQLVALAWVTNELDHLLAPPQYREQLLGFADRRAVILLAVQDPQ